MKYLTGLATAFTLLFVFNTNEVLAQSNSEAEDNSSWRFGATAGANYNMLGLGLQDLTVPGESRANFIPFELNDGDGFGAYLGGFAAYHSDSWWGTEMRLGFDARSGEATEVNRPSQQTFDATVYYLALEPLLVIDPWESDGLHFKVGPTVNYTLESSYDIEYGEDNERNAFSDIENEEFEDIAFGFNGGVAFDIPLTDNSQANRWMLTPYVEAGYIFDQREAPSRNPDNVDDFDDVWSTVTVRAGVQLGMDFGTATAQKRAPMQETRPLQDGVEVSLGLPVGGVVETRMVDEYFPLLNNVFFEPNSSEIPARYKLLNSAQAERFKENNLLADSEIGNLNLAERYSEQMYIYHNVLNVYASRLQNNPNATVTLYGSAPRAQDGNVMAANIRDYWVNVFNIDSDRIRIVERNQPIEPSGTESTPAEDRRMVYKENRRVDIEFSDDKLREPVHIQTVDYNPLDDDLVFALNDAEEAVSWTVTVEGENEERTFGPFMRDVQRIDAMQVLGDRKAGEYSATIRIETLNGQTLSYNRIFTLSRSVERDDDYIGQRYSVTFPYDEEDPMALYEDFLENDIAPRLSDNSIALVYGFTDTVGDEEYNYELSQERAAEVGEIIREEARMRGIDTPVQVIGYGENDDRLAFDNSLPEGRFYNRTVFIELIP